MAQLTWRNVDAPDTARTVLGMGALTGAISNSFDRLGQVFEDRHTAAVKKGTGDQIARLMMAKDVAGLEGMRGTAMDPGNWQLDNAQVGEAFNNMFNTLQERGIKSEQILDDTEMRNKGGAFVADLMNVTRNGGSMDPLLAGSRIAGKFASDYTNAWDTNNDNKLQQEEFGFRKIDANRNYSLQVSENAAQERDRVARRNAEKGPELAYQAGLQAVESAIKSGVVTPGGILKVAAKASLAAGDTEEQSKARVRGMLTNFAAMTDPTATNLRSDTVRDAEGNELGTVKDLLMDARAQTNYEKGKLANARTQVKVDDLGVLSALNSADLNLRDDQVMARSMAPDDAKPQVTQFIRDFPDLPPALVVAATNRMLKDTSWGSWDMTVGSFDESEVSKVLTKLTKQYATGAFQDKLSTQESLDKQAAALESAQTNLQAELLASSIFPGVKVPASTQETLLKMSSGETARRKAREKAADDAADAEVKENLRRVEGEKKLQEARARLSW